MDRRRRRINNHKHLQTLTDSKPRSPLQDLNRPSIHQTTAKSKLTFVANPKSISKSNTVHLLMPSKSKPLLPSQLNKNTLQKSQFICQNANPRLHNSKEVPRKANSGKPLVKSVSRNANASFVSAQKCTPIGKVASVCATSLDCLPSVVRDDDVGGDVDRVRTPPVEVSVSPEIQCGSHAKILASKSGATPVCYGAGHLLSGVTDRRKCRRRGSLKGGFEKTTTSLDYRTSVDDDDVSVPLLAGASVRWHLSPKDERNTDDQGSSDLGNKLRKSDLVCDLVNYSGIDNVASKMEDRSNRLDCRQSLEFNRVLEFPDKIMEEQFSATSCNSFELSTGSLSSSNMIQTPNSDLSSGLCLGSSDMEIEKNDFIESDISLLTSKWGAQDFEDMDLSSDSVDLTRVQKNEDCVSSWVSDTTLGNLGLSQMRISWRDGLESTAFERDEFDCCRCLSDEEEIDTERGAVAKNHLDIEDDDDLSPEILDYEPIISDKQKGKATPLLANTCAESIFTNGSSLFASADSDWSGCLSDNNCLKFSTHN